MASLLLELHLYVLFLLATHKQISTVDWSKDIYGINLKVTEQSGKARISHKLNEISVLFEQIQEIDRLGNPIDLDHNTNLRHTFRNFATTQFRSTGEEYIVYRGLDNYVTAFRKNFTADLAGPAATIDYELYVFNTTTMFPGANSTEYYQVYNGSVKFAFTIRNWPFCGINNNNCKDQNGAERIGQFLDVYVAVQGKKDPIVGNAKSRGDFGTRPITYYYGAGDVTYSYKYFSNGTWNEMQGHPRITKLNDKDVIVFRFPTFLESVYYDPIINITSTWYTTSGEALSAVISHRIIACCLMVMFFISSLN